MQFATGAMSSLLPKLGKLILEEYKLSKSVKDGIKGLKAELEHIEAALVKVSDVPLDQLDPQLKIWASEVRDLSYVIEDSLDSSMVRLLGLQQNNTHTIKGFFEETINKITRLKARHKIANDITNIERLVKKVMERRDRYTVMNIVSNFATTTIDLRLPTLYNEVSNLVGIDKEIEELVNRLSDAADPNKNRLKTTSVVGFGGLGKTTLVKVVYDKLNRKFDCGCFVPVGQKPDKKKVLGDILYGLDKEKYVNIIGSQMDEKQLIDESRRFLAYKRYLIVIDDIWDTSTWTIVKCALLDSNPRSRIIVTTRSHEVAEQVGGVYIMKQLSDDNSQKLLYTRIYGGEGVSMDIPSTEVINKILRKCAGVPLSIITIASLLVGKRKDDWSKVYDAIGFGNDENESVQNTRKIISFSYYDLPCILKTCLLYMCIFLEDSFIEKDMLIWKWAAEGFITDNKEIGLFEQGENYFNQLVNRSMIVLVEPDSAYGQILGGCFVHDMVLDMIFNLSGELNFATILDKKQNFTSPSEKNSNLVRRLAIHNRYEENYAAGMEVGHLRSFSLTSCSDGKMPPLRRFKALRVLALHNCGSSARDLCLDDLGKLIHLRYLGLVLTPVTKLPRDTGYDLKFLQTLDVRYSGITELPVSVGELRELVCLRAFEGTKMLASIGKLTCLEELELYHVDVSPNFATELRNLTRLRVLQILFDEMDKSTHKTLVESVCKLRKIQNLGIQLGKSPVPEVDDWEEWVPPSEIHTLYLLTTPLPRRPRWMDFSCVPHISFLVFSAKFLKLQDMQILGRFASLRYLSVNCDNLMIYTVGPDEFHKLRYLKTNIEIICGGEGGALMMLQELKCRASVEKQQGVGSLVRGSMPLLQKATFLLECEGCSAVQVEEAATSLKQAAEAHPNRPTMEIRIRAKEESSVRRPNMLMALGRTVVVVTMGQSNVRAEYQQAYLNSVFSSVLNNPVIHDLLLKLGSQSGLEYSLDYWRRATKVWAEKYTNDILNDACRSDRFGDNMSEMMQQMMPVVSQVLAGLPPFESARWEETSYYMFMELGRTVLVLTIGQSNVLSDDLRDYFSSIFPSVLNNPVIEDLLLKLGSESGSEYPLYFLRHVTKVWAQKYWMNFILNDAQDLHGPGTSDSSDDNMSEMMEQMMPVVSQVLAGLPPFESSLHMYPSKGIPSAEEESSARSWRVAASDDMLAELGRTVLVLGQSNVRADELQVHFRSMFLSVLSSPVIVNLLSDLGSHSGLHSPHYWRTIGERYAENPRWMDNILNAVQDVRGSSDDLSELMLQMMPVVSQVLAGFPPFESSLHPQHNDDGKLGGELDSSHQQENDGTDKIFATNEEAGPSRLP